MTGPATLTALILAGSRDGAADPLAIQGGVSHKALLPVDGTPMVLRVIRALQQSPAVGRIIVVCERKDLLDDLPEAASVAVRHAETSPSASVAAALAEFGTPLLVTTADHALLTPEIVKSFLSLAPSSADAVAAVARSEIICAAYPDTRRTWLRLRDGLFSGCNLFLLQHEKASLAVVFWRKLEAHRKHPWTMARLIGLSALVGYAFKTLTMDKATRLLSRRSGASLAVITLPFADAAVDVDKPADLFLVERTLAARRAA
ncbi:nucleotidyltransferase family protein [Acidisoma cellulosilytica]|uniref:Nucleotidyltransferase family protein n=1 Tax=Acidisoma cellulosilyticum TaxID=2802395 RepID=A0A963Z4G7_9PROT|nr:nucleotidyltransferase family protein [Acidisoma cellulosilyticum]MCB8882459.1 nucleotidyltransferase family protein [Acidisoma cellulosilyticum]